MADQSTDLSANQQPEGTTKIENGIAYDISGKPLGPANVPDEQKAPAALAPPPGFKQLAPPPGFKTSQETLPPPPGFKTATLQQPAEQTGDEYGGEGYKKIAEGIKEAVTGPSTFVGQVKEQPYTPGLSPELQTYSRIADVFKNSFFSTEAKKQWAQLGEGASNVLHGQISQGLQKMKDAISPHITPGSPMEKQMQALDPTFKATGHPYVDDRTPLNPIVDIGQFVDKKEHPIGKAIAEAASSFTTPDNVAIMVGTGGLGVASSSTKLAMANKLLSAGFTAQAIGAGYKNSQAFAEAYDKGDEAEAEYQLAHMVLSGAMATVAGSHTLGHDMPLVSATDKAVAGKAVEVAKNVSASAGRVVGDVTNKIAGSLGISNDFNTVIKNLSRPSAKQYQAFKGKIANASEDLQAILNKNPNVEDPKSFADAIDSHIQEHEQMLQREAGVTADSNVPVSPNLMRDLTARLDKFFADNKGEFPDDAVAEAKKKLLERVLQSRNGEHLQQPNLFEAENVRRGLNNESYPVFGQKMNAYQAGALELADELRDKIDKGYESRGVDNVQEWRGKEKDLIDIRDRIKLAQKKAEDMGEPSLWKSTIAKVGAPSAILAAAFGHVPGAAAIGLGIAADYLHQRAVNPNALVERAAKIAGKNTGATATEPERFSTVNPNPNPPTTPPVMGTGSGTIGPAIQPPATPINHSLYADLASHYGETLGQTPYTDLEGRFLIDVADKKSHGVPLQPAEKALLGKYNQHLANQQAESEAAAQKLAEEKKTAAQEVEAKKQEQAASGLVTATHPPFETTEHLPVPARYAEMGYTPQRVGVHELAHQIMVDEYGHGTGDIINHHHDQIDPGSLAEARWEKPNFMDEDGKVKPEKIPEILAILHAGVVGEELVHNIPLHENPADDIEIARKIVKDAGFSPAEAGMIMKAAEMKAREVLTAPGVTDIIKRYTEHRQAGLDKDTHMSAETVGQAVQEVRHARGKNAKTDNEARVGKENKTGPSGNESGGEGAAKGEPKKPVQPSGKGGAAVGAIGGEEPRTNLKSVSGAKFRNREEGSGVGVAERLTQGGHAGGGVASEEELARPGRFVKISRSGIPTDQGKVPDFNLAAGEAGYQVKPSGEYELKAGQETPATKRGVEGYSREVFPRTNINVPPERTTGSPETDAAIKEGGGVPGGVMGHAESPNHVKMFHDPQTGTTLGFAANEPVTAEATKQKLAASRAEYAVGEARKAAQGSQSGVVKVEKGADDFNKANGRPPVNTNTAPHNTEFAKRVADAFDEMKHNPADPKVKAAYDAMKNDVDKQWDYATKKMGIKFEPWTKEGQPYANSKEMVKDVKDNNHLYFFQGGESPADNPLQEVDPKTGLSYNDKFRAVHDLFGHAAQGNQFGPKGEEAAYQLHRQMFSPEAVPALTTETRGQNSWVNFGKHLRNEAGEIPGKGEQGYVPATERPYAEQKTGLLPEEFHAAEPEAKEIKTNLKPKIEPQTISDKLVDTYGTTNDPHDAGFILSDGRMVPLHGEHNTMMETLYNKYGDIPMGDAERIAFINNEQAVRTRLRRTKGGNEVVFSVPKQGVTPEQLEQIKKSVGQLRNGNAVMEISEGEGKSAKKEFARVSDVEPMLREIGALPEGIKTNLRPKGSTVPLMENPLPVKGTLKGDEIGTLDIVKALNRFSRKSNPALEPGSEPKEMVARAKKIAEDEAKYQLAQSKTGTEWYTTEMKDHDKILQGLRPELAQGDTVDSSEAPEHPVNLTLFKAAEAILSSGKKPYANVKSALKAWDIYNETREFPPTNPAPGKEGRSWGPRNVAVYANAFNAMNRLIKEKGEKGAADWLLSEHPVSELKQYNEQGVSGKKDDEKPGAMILGEKRGPFMQNLHGIESKFTADMWVSRTWNRWMGTLDTNPHIGEKGEMTSESDTPRNNTERALMKESFEKTAKKLNLTTSSLQAVLWYYEQALYRAHGIPVESWSFSDAAKRVAKEANAVPEAEQTEFNFGENEGKKEHPGIAALAKGSTPKFDALGRPYGRPDLNNGTSKQ